MTGNVAAGHDGVIAFRGLLCHFLVVSEHYDRHNHRMNIFWFPS